MNGMTRFLSFELNPETLHPFTLVHFQGSLYLVNDFYRAHNAVLILILRLKSHSTLVIALNITTWSHDPAL